MKRLVTLLIMSGCTSGPTLDELYLQRAHCVESGAMCHHLDEAVAAREKVIRERKNAQMSCPPGYVAVCTDRDRYCGRKSAPEPVTYSCLSRSEVQRMLERIW